MRIVTDTVFGRMPHHEVLNRTVDSIAQGLQSDVRWCWIGFILFGLIVLAGIIGLNIFFKDKK